MAIRLVVREVLPNPPPINTRYYGYVVLSTHLGAPLASDGASAHGTSMFDIPDIWTTYGRSQQSSPANPPRIRAHDYESDGVVPVSATVTAHASPFGCGPGANLERGGRAV
jgi:hypothetical protein